MDPLSADPVAAAAASAAPTVPAVEAAGVAPVAVEPPPTTGKVFQFVGGPLDGESRRLGDDPVGHHVPGGDRYELNAGRMVYVGTRHEPTTPTTPAAGTAVAPAGDVVDSAPPAPATEQAAATETTGRDPQDPLPTKVATPPYPLPRVAVGRVDPLPTKVATPPYPLPRVAVGRVVHYVLPPGSPYEGQHRAAEIVQTWAGDEVHVNLLVKKGQANDFRGGAGNFGRLMTDEFTIGDAQIILPIILLGSCRHDEEKKEPGTWHWPERV